MGGMGVKRQKNEGGESPATTFLEILGVKKRE